MRIHRRRFLQLTTAAAFSAASPAVMAQAYPSRPVRLLVGFAPGGGQDILARLIGNWLSERLGQQIVIENRPGQAASIARRSGGALAAGRLHALPDRPEQRDQPHVLRQSQLRHRQGHASTSRRW